MTSNCLLLIAFTFWTLVASGAATINICVIPQDLTTYPLADQFVKHSTAFSSLRQSKQLEFNVTLVSSNGNKLPKDLVEAARLASNATALYQSSGFAPCDFAIGFEDDHVLLHAAPSLDVPLSTHLVSADDFSPSVLFPRVARTSPTDAQSAEALVSFLHANNWEVANAFAANDFYGKSMVNGINAKLMNRQTGYLELVYPLCSSTSSDRLEEQLINIRDNGESRLILVLAESSAAISNVVKAAQKLFMNQGHIFIFSSPACRTSTGTDATTASWNRIPGSFCIAPSYSDTGLVTERMKFQTGELDLAFSEQVAAGFPEISLDEKTSLQCNSLSTCGMQRSNEALLHDALVRVALAAPTTTSELNSRNYPTFAQSLLDVTPNAALTLAGQSSLDVTTGDRTVATFTIFNSKRNEEVHKVGEILLSGSTKRVDFDPDTSSVYWLLKEGGAAPSANVRQKSLVEEADSSTLSVGIITLLIIAGILLLAVIIITVYNINRFSTRPDRYAPTESGKEMAIAVVDVLKGSELWNSVDKEMAAASKKLDRVVHNTTMKYKGFQIPGTVLTSLDAKRIVFPTADDALAFAHDLQEDLVSTSWGAPNIEQFYRELDKYRGLNTYCVPYKDIWNGPRVKISLHAGPLKIDSVTKKASADPLQHLYHRGRVVSKQSAANTGGGGGGGVMVVGVDSSSAATTSKDKVTKPPPPSSVEIKYSGAALDEAMLANNFAQGGQVVCSEKFIHLCTSPLPESSRVVGYAIRGDKRLQLKDWIPSGKLSDRVFKEPRPDAGPQLGAQNRLTVRTQYPGNQPEASTEGEGTTTSENSTLPQLKRSGSHRSEATSASQSAPSIAGTAIYQSADSKVSPRVAGRPAPIEVASSHSGALPSHRSSGSSGEKRPASSVQNSMTSSSVSASLPPAVASTPQFNPFNPGRLHATRPRGAEEEALELQSTSDMGEMIIGKASTINSGNNSRIQSAGGIHLGGLNSSVGNSSESAIEPSLAGPGASDGGMKASMSSRPETSTSDLTLNDGTMGSIYHSQKATEPLAVSVENISRLNGGGSQPPTTVGASTAQLTSQSSRDSFATRAAGVTAAPPAGVPSGTILNSQLLARNSSQIMESESGDRRASTNPLIAGGGSNVGQETDYEDSVHGQGEYDREGDHNVDVESVV